MLLLNGIAAAVGGAVGSGRVETDVRTADAPEPVRQG
jgi:hypothetical protein